MLETRRSRGLPVPSVLQLALLALAICAGWLIWSQWCGPASVPGDQPDSHGDDVAAGLERLRDLEAVADAGADALPELLANLASDNQRVRRYAIFALRRLGPEAHEALGPIADRFADDDPQTRAYAISAYWHIGREPNDVAARVAPMLADDNADVRQAAATVLETIGPTAVGPVTRILRGDAAAARVPGLQLLRRIGWDKSQPGTEEALHELGHDPDSGVRLEALLTLARWGRPSPVEIRELLQQETVDVAATVSRQATPREWGLWAIVRLGPSAVENLPDALALLSDERAMPRFLSAVLAALRSMKTAALPVAPRLLTLLAAETNRFRRFDVASTLLEIGADASEVGRVVAPLLTDADSDTRFHAGRLYAAAVPQQAREQVSALIPKLGAEDAAVRDSALYAIWGLAPEAREAVGALALLLKEQDPRVAHAAAKALCDIGPDAAPAIPTIRALLAHRSPSLDGRSRGAMIEALGRIGAAAGSALPELLAELRDPRFLAASMDGKDLPSVAAIPALAAIGDRSPDVLTGLQALLSSRNRNVRMNAFRALMRLAPDSPDVLAGALNCLVGARADEPAEHTAYRVELILAIGSLPVDRQAAVQPLVGALVDADAEVRKAAAWTLGKIGPGAEAALPALHESLAEWKNSFYEPPLPWNGPVFDESHYSTIEISRWHDTNRALLEGQNRRLTTKSVEEVVREAIVAIESNGRP